MKPVGGYMKKFLRVDLSSMKIKEEELGDELIEKYVGGTGFGARFLYDEVPPGVEWNDPKNRLIVLFRAPGGDPDLRDRNFFRRHQRAHDQPGRVFSGQRSLWRLPQAGGF